MPFCGFSAGNRLLCGVVAASTGDSRRYYCWEWSESLGGGGGGAGHIWVSGEKRQGADVRLVLLPLITEGLLRAAPINSMMVNTMGCCCCYR